jgi:hypothetical protein
MGRVYSQLYAAERQAIPGRGARLLDQNDAKIMIMIVFVNINRIPGASYTTSIYQECNNI